PQLMAMDAIYLDARKRAKTDGNCKECSEKYFKTFFPFNDEMLENLSRAVDRVATINAISDFLKEVLVPKKCQEDLIEMPKVKIKEEHLASKEALRNKMIELFE